MPGLTRLVLRHRLIVAVFWLAAAVAGYATISHTTARLSANFSLPGEAVVTLSANSGTGGYAAIFVSDAPYVASLKDVNMDPALAVAVVPNGATAHLALTQIARIREGERVLVHGALGGLAAGFPGIARQLGASRVTGTVRASDLDAARQTGLPYDEIIDSAELPARLPGERFEVIIDPVGGAVRTASIDLLAPTGRLLLVGNASGDWNHQIDSNRIWRGNLAVLGFSTGSFLPGHKDLARPAATAAIRAAPAGLAQAHVETLPSPARQWHINGWRTTR